MRCGDHHDVDEARGRLWEEGEVRGVQGSTMRPVDTARGGTEAATDLKTGVEALRVAMGKRTPPTTRALSPMAGAMRETTLVDEATPRRGVGTAVGVLVARETATETVQNLGARAKTHMASRCNRSKLQRRSWIR